MRVARGSCICREAVSYTHLDVYKRQPHGSIRRYGDADVTRVRFVKAAQRLGFSLDAIAELLRLDDGTHCEEASALAESKLKDVREKIADLARMESVLSLIHI